MQKGFPTSSHATNESNMARRSKQPVSENAFYTALAAIAFAGLAVGTRLSAANVVKKDPTTQGHHLIGFAFIWGIAGVSFLTTLCAAWRMFYLVSEEERLVHPSLRKVTLGFLLLSVAFVAFEGFRTVVILWHIR